VAAQADGARRDSGPASIVPRYAVECQSSNERGASPGFPGRAASRAGVRELPGCPCQISGAQ
jgi:hypothetical protein